MDFESLERAEGGGAEARPGGADDARPPQRNVCLGCPAWASSDRGDGRRAGNAVDGNPSTRWTSKYADNQWLCVDLGAVHELSRIEIRWEAAFASIYLLQGSVDRSRWVTFASAVGSEGWVRTELPARRSGRGGAGAAAAARWLCVHGRSRATSYGFSIWEVRAFGAPLPGAGPVPGAVLAQRPGRAWAWEPDDGGAKATGLAVHVIGGVSGETLCKFSVDADVRVRHIKSLISQSEGTPTCEQQLLLGTAVLADREPLRALVGSSKSESPHSEPLLCLSLLRRPAGRAALLDELQRGSKNLWDLAPELQEEPDFLRAAVRCNVIALKFAPPEVRDDRESMMAVLEEQSLALQYASQRLKEDPELVLAAAERDVSAVRFAAPSLRGSAAFVLAALASSRKALRYAAKLLLEDPGFRAAAEKTGVWRDPEFEGALWLSPRDAQELHVQGHCTFSDARDAAEFEISHIPGAHRHADLLGGAPETPALRDLLGRDERHLLVLYSDNGVAVSRDAGLAHALREDVRVPAYRVLRLAGGLNAWKRAGLPVEGDPRLMFKGQVIERNWKTSLSDMLGRESGGILLQEQS